MLIDHGVFRLYNPPVDHPWRRVGALFLTNDSGVDWYSIAHALPKKRRGIRFAMIRSDGIVNSVGDDAEAMWPIDCRFVETDATDVDIGYSFDGNAFTPPTRPTPAPAAPTPSPGINTI